jgi:hypothetical protein
MLTNTTETEKLTYRGFRGRYTRWLVDSFGNSYSPLHFPGLKRINLWIPTGEMVDNPKPNIGGQVAKRAEWPGWCLEPTVVHPGKLAYDVLIFEPPIDRAEYLSLGLPGESFGEREPILCRIPATFCQR